MDSFTDIISKYFVLDISSTYRAIPSLLFVVLIVALLVGIAVYFKRYERKKAFRMTAGLLLVEYAILLCSSTIFLRNSQSPCGHNYTPFWSYKEIFEGKAGLVVDNATNVMAFLPVGFLLGCAIKKTKWWKVALFACGCSIVIEVTQLLMFKGFSELDDVFNNTLGAIIGFGLNAAIVSLGRCLLARRKETGEDRV